MPTYSVTAASVPALRRGSGHPRRRSTEPPQPRVEHILSRTPGGAGQPSRAASPPPRTPAPAGTGRPARRRPPLPTSRDPDRTRPSLGRPLRHASSCRERPPSHAAHLVPGLSARGEQPRAWGRGAATSSSPRAKGGCCRKTRGGVEIDKAIHIERRRQYSFDLFVSRLKLSVLGSGLRCHGLVQQKVRLLLGRLLFGGRCSSRLSLSLHRVAHRLLSLASRCGVRSGPGVRRLDLPLLCQLILVLQLRKEAPLLSHYTTN